MERRRALKHILLFALVVGTMLWSVEGAADKTDRALDLSAIAQIDPNKDLELQSFYEMRDVAIGVALVVVPDPRIPRHRRAYDNAIVAINQGMLRHQYVLDRFGFPWQQASGSNIADDGNFGLMLFRRDLWREPQDGGNRVIALYVVPESGTYGVQTKAFKRALEHIDSQLDNEKIKAATLGGAQTECNLVVIGPTFSGSLDSIRQIAKSLPSVDYWNADRPQDKPPKVRQPTVCNGTKDIETAAPNNEDPRPNVVNARHRANPQVLRHIELRHINRLEVVSSSNTVASNARISEPKFHSSSDTPHLAYQMRAVSDEDRAKEIASLIDHLGIGWEAVAFLQEASVFGQGFCTGYEKKGEELTKLCAGARRINFPANIADVRFGIRQKQAAMRTTTNIPTSFTNDRLQLEDGSENGSEFPESNQSPLTAVSSELVLDAVLDSLKAIDAKVIVIIATDVRDRLFLFEQLRAKFSKALLIDLATDRLLAHPDFLHASRGALSMASSALQTCHKVGGSGRGECPETAADETVVSAWATDEQGILAAIVADLISNPAPISKHPEVNVTPHLVTHQGLVSFEAVPHRWFRAATVFAILLLVAALGVRHGIGGSFQGGFRRQAVCKSGHNDRAARFAIGLPMLLAICASALWASDFYGFGGLLIMVAVFALLRRWDVLKKNYSPVAAARATTALFALVFIAAAAAMIGGFVVDTENDAIARLMRAVNARPSLGMSYYSALAVALLMTVFALFTQINMAVFLTRNSNALAEVRSASMKDNNATPAMYDSHLLEPLQQNWPMFILIPILFIFVGGSRAVMQGGFKVTPFGPLFDGAVLLAAMITLLLSFNMLLNAIGITRRLLLISRFIRGWIGVDAESPLLWTSTGETPAFASTPILTVSSPGGSSIAHFEQGSDDRFNEWVEHFKSALYEKASTHESRLALYALLASEIFLYQRAVLGVALGSLALAGIVYFYPVSDAEILLLTNLGILLFVGVYSGYATVRFESDNVLCNVLCNRAAKPNFSAGLIGYVTFPFAVLAIFITIVDIPGVLNWGGGFIHTIIGKVMP